jgi:hypothetical protein
LKHIQTSIGCDIETTLLKNGLTIKKVKYAYQEWPHPADTASSHSQKVERRRQHDYTIISFKIDVTNN